jgi:hypothetical protein
MGDVVGRSAKPLWWEMFSGLLQTWSECFRSLLERVKSNWQRRLFIKNDYHSESIVVV